MYNPPVDAGCGEPTGTFSMYQERRRFLKRTGGVVLGVAGAGCTNSDDPGAEATGAEPADGTPTESRTDDTPGGGTETTSTPTAGPNDASTDLEGTVASSSESDLAFVWHRHYEMNGVQGVHGVLENEGDVAYESVTVTAVPSDEGGTELGEFSADVASELPPGERVRFQFDFDRDVEGVARYEIRATGTRGG